MIDLEKLTPAPWLYNPNCSNGPCVCNESGFPILLSESDNDADLQFASLARQVFDVMMRRGWVPKQFDNGTWGVQDRFGGWPMGLLTIILPGGRGWSDPFTALVEADRWYRENVEKEGAK